MRVFNLTEKPSYRMASKKPDKIVYTLFAWQGIQIAVPLDWEPVRLKGTPKKGDVALEDEEGLRLEMRWTPAGKKWQPEDAVNSYVKILEKEFGDDDPPPHLRRNIDVEPDAMDKVESFIVRGAVREAGLAAGCERCSRAILLRIHLRKGDNLGRLAKPIIRSLRDHGDDGWIPWSLFGLRCSLSEKFNMRHSELSAGRLHLSFSRPRSSADAVRLRPASILLKNESLADIVTKQLARMKMKNIPLEETKFKGCEAVKLVEGKRRYSSQRMTAWHDIDSDSVYMACWSGQKKDADEFERFSGSFGDSRI